MDITLWIHEILFRNHIVISYIYEAKSNNSLTKNIFTSFAARLTVGSFEGVFHEALSTKPKSTNLYPQNRSPRISIHKVDQFHSRVSFGRVFDHAYEKNAMFGNFILF